MSRKHPCPARVSRAEIATWSIADRITPDRPHGLWLQLILGGCCMSLSCLIKEHENDARRYVPRRVVSAAEGKLWTSMKSLSGFIGSRHSCRK